MTHHPPHITSLLAKGYAELRHEHGLETVALTARTLHPENIRDVYAETVKYLRALESERTQSAEEELMRSLESLSYGRMVALNEEITDGLERNEAAQLDATRRARSEADELRRDLRALLAEMPESALRAKLEELLGTVS